jgi:hypothetical protein
MRRKLYNYNMCFPTNSASLLNPCASTIYVILDGYIVPEAISTLSYFLLIRPIMGCAGPPSACHTIRYSTIVAIVSPGLGLIVFPLMNKSHATR